MERPYMFFHTGVGFSVMVVGILLSLCVVLAVMAELPESRWVHIVVIFLSCVVVSWVSFSVDEHALKKVKGMKSPPKRE